MRSPKISTMAKQLTKALVLENTRTGQLEGIFTSARSLAQSNGAYYEEHGELKTYSERQIREALQFQKNINYYGTECSLSTWSLNDNF